MEGRRECRALPWTLPESHAVCSVLLPHRNRPTRRPRPGGGCRQPCQKTARRKRAPARRAYWRRATFIKGRGGGTGGRSWAPCEAWARARERGGEGAAPDRGGQSSGRAKRGPRPPPSKKVRRRRRGRGTAGVPQEGRHHHASSGRKRACSHSQHPSKLTSSRKQTQAAHKSQSHGCGAPARVPWTGRAQRGQRGKGK